jgi:hypothetical protein
MYALSGIRTRNPSNQAAADLRLGPHGHRDVHGLYTRITNTRCTMPTLFLLYRISLVIHTTEDKDKPRRFKTC